MKPELFDIPFDHYQRYAAAARLVEALGSGAASVLEVGANRQRLLGEFLPGHDMVFSDLEDQDNHDGRFVQADASALPFADGAFDSAVSLDVFEHIPVELRAKAAAEMARVSRRMVVIACPLDRPWVHTAERDANQHWRDFVGGDYPWLEEHKDYGLVDPEVVERALAGAGWTVLRFGHADARLWASLMGAHFLKEALPELGPLVTAADQLYNHSVFAGDRSDQAYREFFVAVRNKRDLDAVSTSMPLSGVSDPASKRLLESLSATLHNVVGRVRHAESEWSATAQLVRDANEKASWAERQHELVEVRYQAAVQLEAELRRQLELAVGREAGASEREVDLRNQLQVAKGEFMVVMNEREVVSQRYADLLEEHRGLMATVRRRWRITLVALGLTFLANVAALAVLLLGQG